MNKIEISEIENILGFEVDQIVKTNLDKFDLSFNYLSQEERDSFILDCINFILNDYVKVGAHRKDVWENGWNENYVNYNKSGDYNDLIPKYFGKSDILRWKGDFIKANTTLFDYKITSLMVDAVILHFLNDDVENFYEFGCGPAFNLYRLSDYKPHLNYVGLDWVESSQNTIRAIREKCSDKKIEGRNFDYFNIDHDLEIRDNSVIMTCGSLEQIGTSYKELVDFWISKRPSLCINFEHENQMLDSNKLVDKLTILLAEKRNYLSGYFNYLKSLESQGKVEIVYCKRLFFGTKMGEGAPVIVWRPK